MESSSVAPVMQESGTDTRQLYSLESFPLRPPLPLPEGVGRDDLFEWLRHVHVEDAPDTIASYCEQDFERFLHTFGLVQRAIAGSSESVTGLELGANPYFTTMLLRQFTPVDWRLANYFGPTYANGNATQRVFFNEFSNASIKADVQLEYAHFNIEEDAFPFESESLGIVLFCEIIEHLLNDPIRVLREIKRILKPNGTLVLTTPNVARIENVARMIVGSNINDGYSAYGPYGRHNREYNKHELYTLLNYLGFTVDEIFSADVHLNQADAHLDTALFGHLIDYRKHDLGQYIFIRARKTGPDGGKRPGWLYRSYDPSETD
ncbi:methyltransferase domain-containing protein [Paraburkholderia piptadeniae]|uniref:methyltransferase domain-containing protein n=1 Tax=Paraburkholderia piptadeniae TaxID=1701573 RepID=UPI00135C326A|nr:methyltransferase domain-containing protein [Paraburkholderia piptadeniae]